MFWQETLSYFSGFDFNVFGLINLKYTILSFLLLIPWNYQQMGREKMNMNLIGNEKTRYKTYQKRKMGLMKKAEEFTILCDVDACMILYAPLIGGHIAQPEIWPKDPNKVQSLINSYQETSKEECGRRATNISAFLEARKKKIEEEIVRLRRKNAENKYPTWDYLLNSFSYDELKGLSSTLNNKIEQVKLMIASRKSNQCLIELGTPLALMETSHSQSSQGNSSCSSDNTLFQEGQGSLYLCKQPQSEEGNLGTPCTLTEHSSPQPEKLLLQEDMDYWEVFESLPPIDDVDLFAGLPIYAPEPLTQMRMAEGDYTQCYEAASSNSLELTSMMQILRNWPAGLHWQCLWNVDFATRITLFGAIQKRESKALGYCLSACHTVNTFSTSFELVCVALSNQPKYAVLSFWLLIPWNYQQMDREKMNMELRGNEKTRYKTYQKRKMGLMKKAEEFTILCDIDACMILYAPQIGGHIAQPEIWPNDPNKVQSLINSYQETSKEEHGRRATNISAFLEARKKKIEEEIVRLRRVNAETTYPTWDYLLNSFSYDELKDLYSTLKNKIEQVKLMIASRKSNQSLIELGTPLALMETSHPQSSQGNSSCLSENTMFQEGQGSLHLCKQPQFEEGNLGTPCTLTENSSPHPETLLLQGDKDYWEVFELLPPIDDADPFAGLPIYAPEPLTQMMVAEDDYTQCYEASSSNSFELTSMTDLFVDCSQARWDLSIHVIEQDPGIEEVACWIALAMLVECRFCYQDYPIWFQYRAIALALSSKLCYTREKESRAQGYYLSAYHTVKIFVTGFELACIALSNQPKINCATKMGREKMSMELRGNEKTRYKTYQKRKMGLMKKVEEFTILCDVDACMILYAPQIGSHTAQPEIWPKDPNKVQSLINSYQETSKEERGRRATNISAFLEARKKKIEEEIVRLRRENAEPKCPSWDSLLNSFSYDELNDLSSTLNNKIEQVKLMIASRKSNQCLIELGTPLALMETSHPQSGQGNSSCSSENTLFQEGQSSLYLCKQPQFEEGNLGTPCTLTESSSLQPETVLLQEDKDYWEVFELLPPIDDVDPFAGLPIYTPEPLTRVMVAEEDYTQCYEAPSSNIFELTSMIDFFVDCSQARWDLSMYCSH
ncbi:Transcription factor, MADS-box [Dillenia turbinata]|uniref:Transcription factor, MADS-box n=1 Tax=Dillenia turbinata TaxID=194707 RepID=A0AAN8ZCP1_9MAGN